MPELSLPPPGASGRARILIVGGGFAGINAAKALAAAPVEITLVDQHNYHLFQPLLYQVATAALSPADIACPIRQIFRHQANVKVAMARLEGIDLDERRARFQRGAVDYDYLILATGATHSYFGHDEWQRWAPGLKTIDDALEIRRRVLLAYEEAEWEEDEATRRAKLTFVVVGGGPTGVEMAGALKEIAARSIPKDFRFIDTTSARVILVEAGARLLAALPEKLGNRARTDLEAMGVQVRLNSCVTAVGEGEVRIGDERLPAHNVIWAAGVKGSSVAAGLGVPRDRQGRIEVCDDLSLPGHPEVFAVGDLAHIVDLATGEPVPGVAPAAIQMGEHVARLIRQEVGSGAAGAERAAFRYRDKGTMATIGRNRAVATVKGRNFTGFFAWVLWCAVHIYTLIGFRRRLFVMMHWLWSYFSQAKTARLITGGREAALKSLRRERSAEVAKNE